jgi:CBS domain-containing protein
MQCAELMQVNPPFVLEDDVVQTAAKAMRDSDSGFLPVCEFSHRLAGAVTDHDLVTKICADDLSANTHRVHEIMSNDVAACRPEDDVEQAFALMDNRDQQAVPIVDDRGQLCGLIKRADRARHRAARPTGLMRESVARQLQGDE